VNPVPTSAARTVRVESADVVVPEDDVEGNAEGGTDERVEARAVGETDGRAVGFVGDAVGADGEPDADIFSSSIGDGRFANVLVTGEVWLFTRADISRASRWR
jgi:hypothetical protein